MRTALLTLTMCVLAASAQAKYSGGTGEPNDPYQIATFEDLIALGATPGDYDKHFLLTADIDLDPNLPGGKVFDKAVIAPAAYGRTWWGLGMGVVGVPFAGSFNGNGHVIFHLTMAGESCLALFGYVATGAEVTNLGIHDVAITGTGMCIGALVGLCDGGKLNHCHTTGVVHGSAFVGGIVGINRGDIAQCYSSATVHGSRGDVGGLVGSNGGVVVQCCSTGTVFGDGDVGGLVGSNGKSMVDGWSGEVIDCYSTGVVTGIGEYGGIGGLAGRNDGSRIIRCYSTGTVAGNKDIGGLVGSCRWGTEGISSSFWDIQTSGQATSAGGTGLTTADMQTAGTFFDWRVCDNEGGWTINEGQDYPRLWWENRPGDPIRMPKLSDLLLGRGTENDPFLIYTHEDVNVLAKIPCEQDKHFRLGFLLGEGTQENPYLVGTGAQLNLIGRCWHAWGAHFKLVADIDLSGFDGNDGGPAFNVIGTSATPFTGVFDGDGHTITGRSLFGYVDDPHAEIKNICLIATHTDAGTGRTVGSLAGSLKSGTIADCYAVNARVSVTNGGTVIRCTSAGEITGTHYIGGLAGQNSGTIAECTNTATVSATGDHVGGLVGRNTGTVTQCYNSGAVSSGGSNGYVGGLVGHNVSGVVTGSYNTGRVSGSQFAGGLVGYNNDSTVTDCYNTGAVSGHNFVGGTVGYNDRGLVTQCYSSGSVSGTSYVGGLVGSNYRGSIATSFWDIQTSKQSTSAGGTGKTTAEMQAAATFLNAGWDFVGEMANGTDDIWWILERLDYPHLWWEATELIIHDRQ